MTGSETGSGKTNVMPCRKEREKHCFAVKNEGTSIGSTTTLTALLEEKKEEQLISGATGLLYVSASRDMADQFSLDHSLDALCKQ